MFDYSHIKPAGLRVTAFYVTGSYITVGNKASGFYANHHLGGNTWYNNTAYKISAADFGSVNETLLPQKRHTDYTLPNHGFLRLVTGSDLIDKGMNIGFPYKDASPNLGCFENGISGSPVASGSVAP